jgi:FAD/FMN-containing dehydrogenase
VLILVVVVLIAQPVLLLLGAWLRDRPKRETWPTGHVDDASRLNLTRVADIIPVDPTNAEEQLRNLLERARNEQLKVAIAGARHSMGGHTIYPDGLVLDMLPFNRLTLDRNRQILHAGAGARWREIVPYLDAQGYSVAVMQSNNDFSVGGSISVNCHGWQHGQPPIASTVESFRLMTADGIIHRCSRTENQELFGLALGGYGLFGVILDVDLRIVPNERYKPDVAIIAAQAYPAEFAQRVRRRDDAGMVFGRLCVVPGEKTFLRQAVLTVFRKSPCPKEHIPSLKGASPRKLMREVFRAQIGTQAGKELRWQAETGMAKVLAGRYFSRNQLVNEPSEIFREQNADRTDLLHEYFIPPARFADFLDRLRDLLPREPFELMNITVRDVKEDRDTVLRFADRDLFAVVMLFNVPRTRQAEETMKQLTKQLIDAALVCEGRYYLPYRLHATPAQFEKAYPQARRFFERKRAFDPDERFQNQFYKTYGGL